MVVDSKSDETSIHSLTTLFKMNLFGTAHGWEGKKVSLPKFCHTYHTMRRLGTVMHYLEKIQNIYNSHDTTLVFCWHQHLFTENQQLLLYQGISFSKISYSRPSESIGILNERFWRHISCPCCHQQNFITWLKLYCRCGHVTKV